MGVKPTYLEVVKEFESRGLILLSTEYIGANDLLEYVCKCGTKSNIRLSKLKQGQTCRSCMGTKLGKYKLEDVRAIFEVNDCFLLSTEYIDNNQILDYVCSCGNQSTTRLRSFMRGHRCLKCAPSKMGLGSVTHGQTSIHNGFKVTNEQIINFDSKTCTFICDCGIKETISIYSDSVNSIHLCKKCIIKRRLENKTRNSSNYCEWRQAVYEQDDYTCIKCNHRGGELAAHHIESWSLDKELRFELSNGAVMCKTCHKEFHSLFGYRTTLIDLQNFL